MKKIFLLAFILFSASILRGQIIRIDIDSIADNQEIVISKKWHVNDSVRIITYKVNGQVYGDSMSGNFNMTVEWKLDTTKAVKKVEADILAKRQAQRDQKEDDLKRFYEKNPDLVKPKNAAKQQNIIPKSYGNISGANQKEAFTVGELGLPSDYFAPPPPKKKRKWYQRKK